MPALNEQTPQQIDEQLAELDRQSQRAEQNLKGAFAQMHRALGERSRSARRGQVWPTTHEQALAACRAKVVEPDYQDTPWGYSPAKALAEYDQAQKQLAAIAEAMRPLEAEFERRGWSRFFIVQANDGHVHSSMGCQTCNRRGSRTRFDWNPHLSGLSEAEAVKHLGDYASSLCTVCFPSAPVEWTQGKQKRHCPGEWPAKGSVRGYGRNAYGRCPVCGQNRPITQVGALRKHPPSSMGTTFRGTTNREEPDEHIENRDVRGDCSADRSDGGVRLDGGRLGAVSWGRPDGGGAATVRPDQFGHDHLG